MSNPHTNRFTLLDDGTLDTVVVCSKCGTELRYNYDPSERLGHETWLDHNAESAYDDFIVWALCDADAEHICNETP